eukprot:CAMPEP_0174724284 /NCGR_PEP_ID=MMETSP1094-20130205/42984_1 /TAXON_ID=156173 /ORGANISM="Chrysochromulina brevifilum, Strain UTEX LB 985" /LENGTH=70 /DNA_ID=CAMNT_0015925475 /DNA_START=229 /DNA_END=439 /DNA_ORIENTATION=-
MLGASASALWWYSFINCKRREQLEMLSGSIEVGTDTGTLSAPFSSLVLVAKWVIADTAKAAAVGEEDTPG